MFTLVKEFIYLVLVIQFVITEVSVCTINAMNSWLPSVKDDFPLNFKTEERIDNRNKLVEL